MATYPMRSLPMLRRSALAISSSSSSSLLSTTRLSSTFSSSSLPSLLSMRFHQLSPVHISTKTMASRCQLLSRQASSVSVSESKNESLGNNMQSSSKSSSLDNNSSSSNDDSSKIVSNTSTTTKTAPPGKKSRVSGRSLAPITITPKAANRIKEMLADKDPEAGYIGVRLSVKRRGCNGYSYTMNYAMKDDPKTNGDERCEEHGVVVLVDPKAIFHIVGTVMDYDETELSAEFTFTNPNAKGECGCGESFNV